MGRGLMGWGDPLPAAAIVRLGWAGVNGAGRTCKTSLPPLLLPIETGRRRAKVTRAKCVTCRERFSGSHDDTFRWLVLHRTLHWLQATEVSRATFRAA